MEPRGIRNNNPGNIRLSSDKWQGLAQTQQDSAFFTFKGPTWGIRAMARILINYQDDYNLHSIRDIVWRWAPPVENNTGSYVSSIAKQTGFDPDRSLDLQNFEHLMPLVKAMIWHENGKQPYSDAVITKGLVLAGVEPESRPVRKTTTAKVVTATTAATVTSPFLQVVEKADKHSGLISTLSNIGPWVLAGLVVCGLGYILWSMWDDRKKGLR